MSHLNKSAELSALNDLLQHLRSRSSAEREISELKSTLRNTPTKEYSSTYGRQLPTDNYEKEKKKMVAIKEKKRSKLLRPYWIIAAALFVVLIIVWFVINGAQGKSTYLYTPEIVQKYNGVYYTSGGDEVRAALEITSCSESGKIEGYFEFWKKNFNVNYGDDYGKYAIQGKVISKSKEGYITARIKHTKWIEQPSGYSPLKEMEIKIFENGQLIRGFAYSMSLSAEGYTKNEVAQLETPEILKTYSGEFDPNTAVGTASITIETCDASGKVTGVFEYSFKDGSGKWKVTGQITDKYDDGSLLLTLKPDEQIFNNYMFYYPSTMEVEIYDDYRSFYSSEGMHWFYEDEGLTEAPERADSPYKAVAAKLKTVVFPIYPLCAIILGLLLQYCKVEIFTPEEHGRLEKMLQLDNQNRKENEKNNAAGLAQAKLARQRELADCEKRMRYAQERYDAANARVAMASILSDKDKTVRNVEFLLEKMQSGRADSLKEALLLLDDYSYHEQLSWLQAENARMEAQRRAKLEADLAMHNLNVEYEQRRQANELEKIRKALEE